MPRPEDSILQNLLKPEASPKGDVKRYQQCLFKGDIEQNTPKFILKASKLLMLRPQNSILQHPLPEAGLYGDITKYQ